jgi:hypothetical protein
MLPMKTIISKTSIKFRLVVETQSEHLLVSCFAVFVRRDRVGTNRFKRNGNVRSSRIFFLRFFRTSNICMGGKLEINGSALADPVAATQRAM